LAGSIRTGDFLRLTANANTRNNSQPASPHHLRPTRRQPRRSLAAKKGTGEREVKKKIKGNPQLLLRVPPELQKPLADESAKTGESRQGVLWRIAAKYFKGRKA
jgi:hypothetical protein